MCYLKVIVRVSWKRISVVVSSYITMLTRVRSLIQRFRYIKTTWNNASITITSQAKATESRETFWSPKEDMAFSIFSPLHCTVEAGDGCGVFLVETFTAKERST